MAHKLGSLAKTMSEEAALAYLETNISPAAVYGMELVRDATSSQKLRTAYTDSVSAAVLTTIFGP